MKQKNNRLNRFDEALKNRKFWVIKLSHKKKAVNNLEKLYNSREEVTNFFKRLC